MKILIFILLISSCFQNKLIAQNHFAFLDLNKDSDFNYNAINKFNYNPKTTLDSVFNPVLGNFKVYRFIETIYDYSFDSDSIKEFHKLLIIKTNSLNKIIDAYCYLLEWEEYPSSCALYRFNKTKTKKFQANFSLSDIQFKLIGDNEYCTRDSFLNLNQIIIWEETKFSENTNK